MIKFFRKIRQNLISEGKNGKYFKYAIGEIVLVVIGILIALSINNWNEERKATKREKLFLKEFKTSINRDLFNFDKQYGPRLERKKKGLDSLFHYIQYGNDIHNSLFIKFYNNMRQSIRLGHDSGPYEALKSSGLDYIRNDSLRTAINRTYTLLPFFQYFSHQIDAENNPRISELEYKILNLKTFEPQDDRKYLELVVKVDKIIANQDFLWIYNLEQQKYNSYIIRLGTMKAALNELKTQIEKELKK